MKFWIKIEAILNKILSSISVMLATFFKKLLPNKLKNKIDSPKVKTSPKTSLKDIFKKKLATTKNYIEITKKNTTEKINSVKIFSAKKIIAVKSIDIKSVKPKDITLVGTAFIAPVFSKLFKYLSGLDPKSLMITTTTFVAFSLTSISVYKQVSEIEEKNPEVVREPSSYADSVDRRSVTRNPFRNQDLMFINIPEIDIPIYIENGQGMQVLTIDFSFKANNRYISKYFEKRENEFVLRDRLNKRLQPITLSFPLEKEGKNILRVKIRSELNEMIKDLGIEGQIEDVYIHSILRP